MSRKEINDAVRDALRSLSTDQFKTFCEELYQYEEEPRIWQAEVGDKSMVDIRNLLVSRWTDRVLSRTAAVIKDIGREDVAKELAAKAEALQPPKKEPSRKPPPGQSSSGGAPGSAAQAEEHFVDRYRLELTARVSNINPILDRLIRKKVLQQEQYDEVMELRTTQAKMRFLYSGPLKSGNRSKDVLLEALKEQEPYLIEALEEKEG